MEKESKVEQKERFRIFEYGVLDPRNIPEAKSSNEKLLGPNTLGIEVTIPALAKECGLGNIDPQHTEGKSDKAAIEVAIDYEPLPPQGTTMVTIRADLDALGSMALLDLKVRGINIDENMKERISRIAESDKFARGEWPGPRPLPSLDKLFDDSMANTESDSRLAPIAAAIADFKVPVQERVELMKEWLLMGKEPQSYREKWIKEREEIAKAIAEKRITIDTEDNKISKVISSHRAATSLGYYLSPIVVALNPEFRFQESEPHRKFTISQFKTGYLDLKVVADVLNKSETGWGGSQTIIGSPQGTGSKLEIETIMEIVKKNLKF
ncbi:MAG: hypothetical protein Q7K26_00150 [bacterium]|nr:hypothetical protein [bacterium]